MKRFNLIPKQGKKGRQISAPLTILKKWAFSRVVTLILILSVVIALPNIISKRRRDNLAKAKQQIEAMKNEVRRLQTRRLQSAKDYDSLIKKKLSADERLQYLKEAKLDKPGELSRALAYLPTLIPDEVWINKLTVNRDAVIINGSTLNNQAVSKFMDNLNRSRGFKGSNFNFTQKNELGESTLYSFEIATNLIAAR